MASVASRRGSAHVRGGGRPGFASESGVGESAASACYVYECMRSLRLASALVLLAALAACSRGAPEKPTAVAAAASASPTLEHLASAPTTEAKGTLVLGERITAKILPLASLANESRRYEDQVVATTGTVTAVCQEMGCWMEIRDDSAHAHVRMHGHTFFVPKTASGHIARVQAKVVRGAAGACDESATTSDRASARLELDATGVELD